MADDSFSQADLSNLYQGAMQPLPEAVTAYAQPEAANFLNTDFYAPTFDFTSYTPQGGFSRADLPAIDSSYASGGPGRRPTSLSSPFTIPGQDQAVTTTPLPPARGAEIGGVDVGAGTVQETQPQKGFVEQLLGKADIGKLLTGGLGALMSYQAAQRAQEDAARARAEYEAAAQKASTDVKGLAQPYLTAGGSQLSMALQGALSPAQQQMYQAQQARLAQSAARTGGVGAIQTAAAEQAAYQQALQNQQNMALQLLGPGNQLAYNAVMTELKGTQGGLALEMDYGVQASQAMAGMMQSLGYGVGSVGTQQQKAQQ